MCEFDFLIHRLNSGFLDFIEIIEGKIRRQFQSLKGRRQFHLEIEVCWWFIEKQNPVQILPLLKGGSLEFDCFALNPL